jgi:hypothetical protein
LIRKPISNNSKAAGTLGSAAARRELEPICLPADRDLFDPSVSRACAQCGRAFTVSAVKRAGRPRRYCSETCAKAVASAQRVAWARQHPRRHPQIAQQEQAMNDHDAKISTGNRPTRDEALQRLSDLAKNMELIFDATEIAAMFAAVSVDIARKNSVGAGGRLS